jgi:small subunit ribosomal protein S7
MNNIEIKKKFVNLIMRDGKKSVANKLLNSSLESASKQLQVGEEQLLRQVINNVKPSIDARPKKVGNNSYMIPYAITEEQANKLAIKIIIKASRERREKSFKECLLNELIDAANNVGNSVKKKNEIHKLAEANKSFAFYR